MPVYRTEVPEIHGFEKVALFQDNRFDGIFNFLEILPGIRIDLVKCTKYVPDIILYPVICSGSGNIQEIVLHRPHTWINGNVVIIQNYQDILFFMTGIVEILRCDCL